MDKKKPILQPLLAYAGKRKVLTYLSMVISGISQLLALVPFLYIWAILRDVLAGGYSRIAHYGWMAVAFAIATIVVYFGALMCSHLAAFRIAANMRKALMQHIMTLPIGFLDALGSGKVRKWVQESTQSTETYLAHQLPDKAGMYATMIGLAVLMFLFDWRMGLLCLGTVLLAIIVMVTLMTGPTLRRKLGEYNKALDAMSNEAVEYVRGIPVVKTFGQSVFSFKRFKDSIDQYKQWVIAYTIDLRRPMTLYTTFVNASFAVLIALTLIVVKNGSYTPEFLLNLLYYIIITPAIAVTLNRIMFASENEMIVAEALDKTGRILAIDPLSDPSDAKLPAGGRCLDMGCGSGALAIAVAKRNPQGTVTGVDRWGAEYASFSKKLCEDNAKAEGVAERTDFAQGDALKLDFPDGTFDAVTSNYVYHNIPSHDRQAILMETLRVLKKGGTFAIHDLYGVEYDAYCKRVNRTWPWFPRK